VWPHLEPPFILGHEVCGSIVSKGAQVRRFEVGDRVAFWGGGTGGFAEYFLIHPHELPAVVKLDASIDAVAGAIMEMVAGTARHLVTDDGQWLIGADCTVAVFGLGPSGMLYLQEARALGAARVIGIGKHDFRLNMAQALGADEVMDYRLGDIVERVRDRCGAVDMVVDTTGKDVLPEAVALLKQGGTFVPFGIGPHSVPELQERLAPQGVTVTRGGDAQAAIETCRDWIAGGRMKIRPLVTGHVALKDVAKGLDACLAPGKNALKIAVDMP
jgi:threonine dehydrogenase-like Zn-dependent dehydrogenase